MRKPLILTLAILSCAALMGCGAGGEPIRPQPSVNLNASPGGVFLSGNLGVGVKLW